MLFFNPSLLLLATPWPGLCGSALLWHRLDSGIFCFWLLLLLWPCLQWGTHPNLIPAQWLFQILSTCLCWAFQSAPGCQLVCQGEGVTAVLNVCSSAFQFSLELFVVGWRVQFCQLVQICPLLLGAFLSVWTQRAWCRGRHWSLRGTAASCGWFHPCTGDWADHGAWVSLWLFWRLLILLNYCFAGVQDLIPVGWLHSFCRSLPMLMMWTVSLRLSLERSDGMKIGKSGEWAPGGCLEECSPSWDTQMDNRCTFQPVWDSAFAPPGWLGPMRNGC